MEPRAEPTPSLSVVIPTSRGGADLEACLASLAEQRYAGLEVVVVDNASAAGSIPPAAGGVRILRNEVNLGFVGASNQGIEASRGELVLLLNDDTTVEPGALAAMVEALQAHPAWAACQAKLLLMEDPTRLDTAGSFLTSTGFLVHRGVFEPEEGRFSDSDEIFAAKGAALLVRRAALAQTGAFDPTFFAYFEETDLCWRLWLAGWEVGFAADARVLHKLGATASGLPSAFVQFHSYKNRIRTLLKNLGPARLAWTLPYHVALCVLLAGWYGVRGQRGVGGAILRAIGWNVLHLFGTLRERRRVQRLRRVPDPVLMRRILQPTPLRTFLFYARND
jgi:N-acetylglucosaminyl-diphospho-decaprenol L-rhamnosyltransferase